MLSHRHASVAHPLATDSPEPETELEPQAERDGRLARILGFAGPLVVLAAAVLLLVGFANVEVARGRDAVESQLAQARAAIAQVPRQLGSGDIVALSADLATLDRSSTAARRGSDGFLWAVAGHANLNGGSLRAIRHDARSSATLAAAAVPLRRSLVALDPATPPSAGPPSTASTDQAQLDQLDDLARGLSRYATAAIRVDDPSASALERAALAAGLLPTMAGAEQPRTWTVCRTEAGPCTRVTVTSGRLQASDGSADPTDPTARDLVVVGADPEDVFGPATGQQVWRWDVPTVFGLLYHLGPASITMHSVVAVEQQALDQLTARSTQSSRPSR